MDGREQSKFASDVSYLNRLNMLFAYADENAMGLDVFNWYHSLLAIFRELSTEMKPDEIDFFDKESTLINQMVVKYSNNAKWGDETIEADLYEKLHRYEIKLRKIFRLAGLQLKTTDDAARALR